MNPQSHLLEAPGRKSGLRINWQGRPETRADWIVKVRNLVWLWCACSVTMAVVTWVCFQFHARLGTGGFAYLIIIALVALMDSFITSFIFSLLAAGCLWYFFAEPVLSFRVVQTRDVAAVLVFLGAALGTSVLVRLTCRLRDAAREQAHLLDLSHDAVFVRELNGLITYWNHGAEELYGWSRSEALGKVAHELLQTRFPVSVEATTKILLDDGRWEGELIHTRRDGTLVEVASRWSLQRNANGRPASALETNNDITQRKRAEEVLRRFRAASMAEAQKLSLTGSAGWNARTGEMFWSEQTFSILGYDQGVVPSIDMVLQRVHPDDLARVRHILEQAASTGKDFDFEHRLLMPDGSVTHLRVVAHAEPDEPDSGQFVGAIMDVTAARQAQERLHAMQTELAHATRLTTLGELSASIAHEVNQPLGAIVMNGEAGLRWLDRETPDPEEVTACVQRMIDEALRATEIVRHVRTLTRRADPRKTRLELNEVINEVVSLVQREMSSHHVELRLQLASGLPAILGDRVQLQQVLINLVLNGVQAMADVVDRPCELLIESRGEEGGRVTVALQDAGTGIESLHEHRLFEAFFSTKPDGMGMGLSICRSIIEAHGGEISAYNNHDGYGATFMFSLPAIGEFGEGESVQSSWDEGSRFRSTGERRCLPEFAPDLRSGG